MVTTVFCYYDTVEAGLVICVEYSSEEQIRLKNCSLGAREVARLLKCLLGRHGDLSSGPQHPWGLAIATRNALVGEVEQKVPWDFLVSLLELENFRPYLQKK